jgi:hypothetical protein
MVEPVQKASKDLSRTDTTPIEFEPLTLQRFQKGLPRISLRIVEMIPSSGEGRLAQNKLGGPRRESENRSFQEPRKEDPTIAKAAFETHFLKPVF